MSVIAHRAQINQFRAGELINLADAVGYHTLEDALVESIMPPQHGLAHEYNASWIARERTIDIVRPKNYHGRFGSIAILPYHEPLQTFNESYESFTAQMSEDKLRWLAQHIIGFGLHAQLRSSNPRTNGTLSTSVWIYQRHKSYENISAYGEYVRKVAKPMRTGRPYAEVMIETVSAARALQARRMLNPLRGGLPGTNRNS